MMNIDEIKDFMNRDQFIITNHARIRMFQRNVTTDLIKEIVLQGEVIEEYPNDFPCPSLLILGYHKKNPLHVVIANCENHVRIITVYKPDKENWIDYKKRKRKP